MYATLCMQYTHLNGIMDWNSSHPPPCSPLLPLEATATKHPFFSWNLPGSSWRSFRRATIGLRPVTECHAAAAPPMQQGTKLCHSKELRPATGRVWPHAATVTELLTGHTGRLFQWLSTDKDSLIPLNYIMCHKNLNLTQPGILLLILHQTSKKPKV